MAGQVLQLKREMKDDYGYKEAIKTLRTNIQFCGSSICTIMFTSALPNEGKSDVSLSAAESLAQIGKRVLFVDADIRKSVMVDRCRLEVDVWGLSQYLSGQKELSQIIYETDRENLHMIFAGPYSPNPSELLEEPLFDALLKYGREHYDYVLIDTPPMDGLIDGAVVSARCDGAILVIESGSASYRVEQQVKAQLEKSGCRILGVVLNKVRRAGGGYYRKYYGKYDKNRETEAGYKK